MKKKTCRAEREFGLVVGGVLLVFGLVWLIRGKFHIVAPWVGGLGSLLAAFGIIWPQGLIVPYRYWMKFAQGLSYLTTRIILVLAYFLVVTPIGFTKRLTGWDPLRRRATPGTSYWHAYPESQRDPRHFEKMY
ncbi:MAG: SxtJ family membrane protein [Acidobacteriia bacterium]|nr:SxtJ family membrane protein [Terriglobia bacterium]